MKPRISRLKILYLTYDGLADPLGQSQIIPYLRGISSKNKKIFVISFEKDTLSDSDHKILNHSLMTKRINWYPLRFTQKFGVMGKLWDLFKLFVYATKFQLKENFDVVHCRSYIAGYVGLTLKKCTKVKFIFDMRGLWVDDRRESGRWPEKKLVYAVAYNYFKYIERQMIISANRVIVLTNKVISEIRQIAKADQKVSIVVIPCCADFNYFGTFLANRSYERKALGFQDSELVFGYLGSIGTVYKFDDALKFFETARKVFPNSRFLVISPNFDSLGRRVVSSFNCPQLVDAVTGFGTTYSQVPKYLSCVDILISFRLSTYSQIAASPTKFGEALALGIPVISNSSVGDIDELTLRLNAGATVDLNKIDSPEYVKAVVNRVREINLEKLRALAYEVLDIHVACDSYNKVYEEINAF